MTGLVTRAHAGEQSAQLTLCRAAERAVWAFGLAMLGVCLAINLWRLATWLAS
jgi:hypothetical protein